MQKTIKINPELFTLNKSRNVEKNKTLKNNKKSEMKINLKTNRVKQKLLEKIKDYQRNKQEKNVNENTENIEELNNFTDSLSFLENLSNNYKKKDNDLQLNKSFKIKRNDIGNNIKLELPKELNEMEVVNINNKTYGCLKNGKLPTYREWKRLTQKNTQKDYKTDINKNNNKNNNDNNNKIDNLSLKINTDLNTYHDNLTERENKLNNFKKMYKENNIINNPNLGKNNENCNIEQNITTAKTEITDINTKDNIEKIDISETLNLNCDSNENSIIDYNDSPIIGSIDSIDSHDTETENINHIPKIIRKTKTFKYKLGKYKNSKNNIKKDFKLLQNVNINEVKKYLRKHNLIKIGTNAPNDVLREIYEKSILTGEIMNNNTNNMIHNFINE